VRVAALWERIALDGLHLPLSRRAEPDVTWKLACQNIHEIGACPSLIATLAAGDYVIHHSATRFGGLVLYLSANMG